VTAALFAAAGVLFLLKAPERALRRGVAQATAPEVVAGPQAPA
jgi:hypothetical protein